MNDTTKTTKPATWTYDEAYAWGKLSGATEDWSWTTSERLGEGYLAGYRAGLPTGRKMG